MVISFGDNGLASYGKRMEIDLVDGEDDLTNGMCVNMYGLKGESTAHYESTALLARHPRLTTSAMNAINSLTDSLPNELSGNLGNICSLIQNLSRVTDAPGRRLNTRTRPLSLFLSILWNTRLEHAAAKTKPRLPLLTKQ